MRAPPSSRSPPKLTSSASSDTTPQKTSSQPEAGDFDHVPNKRRKQFLSALVALGAMLGYALLTGMVSIQHVHTPADGPLEPDQDEQDD